MIGFPDILGEIVSFDPNIFLLLSLTPYPLPFPLWITLDYHRKYERAGWFRQCKSNTPNSY